MDVLALVLHFQGLPVVALAFAHLTGDVDVRQEVHFNLQQAVSGAGLAPAPLHVEGEPPGAIPPGLGVRGGGEELPDVSKEPGVGGGVGPGGPADGGLVDGDDLVQKFLPFQTVVLAGADLHPV